MNDKQHVFDWILRILMSCNNTFQIDCAKVVIDLFAIKYADDTLVTELKIAYKYKYDDIHQVLS